MISDYMIMSKESGFTLIELIMIIMIISLVAAVSIPKYQDISLEVKKSGCKNSLMSMRSALSVWQINNITKNQSDLYPDINTLSTLHTVLI